MNIIAKAILTTATALLASITFAKADITCPPPEIVKSESFFISVFDELKPVYGFLSANYSYENHEWTTFFGGLFDNTQTNAERLAVANKVFQSLTLTEPTVERADDTEALCFYFEGDEETNPYFVVAGTPPISMTPANKFYKFLK